jgi:hypothetical protein
MPIDWIDVKSKYKVDPNSSDVKAIAAKYDKELKALATECEEIAKKAQKEKDTKKKKTLEEQAKTKHQSGLIKLRKEAETALSKMAPISEVKNIQSNHDVSIFDAELNSAGLNKDDQKVKEAFAMYNKAVDGVTAKANEIVKKANAEKDQKKRTELEQQAMKSHQAGLIEVRNATIAVLKKIKQS